MKKVLILAAMLAAVVGSETQASLVVQWNFNGTADPSAGAGTVGVIGGVTHSGFNSGGGSSDPTQPGSGYQTTGYPAQSTASGTAGILIGFSTASLSTAQFNGLEFSFDLRTSNTASRWYRVDYSTDGGNNWSLGSATRVGAAANAGDSWHNQNTITLSNTALIGNADAQIRVVSVFSALAFTEAQSGTNYSANTAYEVARNTTSAYAGGTWRFDMVTVTAVPEPSALLLVGSVLGAGFLRRRRS